MKSCLVRPLGWAVAGILSVVSPTWAASLYSVTDLDEVTATAMNSSGQVVGYSTQGGFHTFFYSNGQRTDLGSLNPYAISDNGLITGVYRSSPSSGPDAFLYNNGQITDLGTLAPYMQSAGYGVNNSGQVVGLVGNLGSNSDAFLYSNGQITDLGGGVAYGINNAGQVTGVYNHHAFLYSNGQMTNLGAFIAYGISDNGQVTGTDGGAILYSNGHITGLGTLPLPGSRFGSGGLSVNNQGQVVGYVGSFDPEGPFFDIEVGFLYSDGVMRNLYDLVDPSSVVSFKTSEAVAINDYGQILWTGSPGYAQPSHSYLLTPIPVPEPTTFALLGIGLLAALVIGIRSNPAAR